tara:strand:+ start:293 stop:466 length:174 start_codon:yes stop_codon:yes gene_type:complete
LELFWVIDSPYVFNRECLIHLFSTPSGEAGLRINVLLFEFFSQSMGKVLQMNRHLKA